MPELLCFFTVIVCKYILVENSHMFGWRESRGEGERRWPEYTEHYFISWTFPLSLLSPLSETYPKNQTLYFGCVKCYCHSLIWYWDLRYVTDFSIYIYMLSENSSNVISEPLWYNLRSLYKQFFFLMKALNLLWIWREMDNLRGKWREG